MKNILILIPGGIKPGQPSYERVMAFKKFYEEQDCFVLLQPQPSTFNGKVKLFRFLKGHSVKNVFISMPQFRNWWLFFVPGLNVIIDIRDGWSIAMKTGYGGNSEPQKIKSFIARIFELIAIRSSGLAITCTPGLQKYLAQLSNKEVLLVTNGFSNADWKEVSALKKEILKAYRSEKDLIAVCAGQFSEYGNDKVKKIVLTLVKSYPGRNIKIKLIGSDCKRNAWIEGFIAEEKLSSISIEILPRMLRVDMYRNLLSADIGLAVIRDPNYDFGTKVFDYILCELPILNYFEESNSFSEFFSEFLTDSASCCHDVQVFNRNTAIQSRRSSFVDVLR